MQELLDELDARRPPRGPYLIGITGAVAVGKSTMASALAAEWPDAAVLSTDCFLRANADLEAHGGAMEKGFPDTFDRVALRAAVTGLREGREVEVPVYSHVTYDIDPDARCLVGPSDAVVVEGLHLERFAGDLLDVTVHLTADEGVVEGWYVERFRDLVARAREGEESFYRLFVALDPDQLDAVARHLWTSINLVNLRTHIEPWRDRADLVVRLGEDHRILSILVT